MSPTQSKSWRAPDEGKIDQHDPKNLGGRQGAVRANHDRPVISQYRHPHAPKHPQRYGWMIKFLFRRDDGHFRGNNEGTFERFRVRTDLWRTGMWEV